MSNEKKELTTEGFCNSEPPMKSIPDAISKFYELKRRDENAFLEACKPLMKYLCENHHPHVTVIIDGTRAELLEGLKTTQCNDYIVD